MTPQLLPNDFDELLRRAVQIFWRSRASGSSTQAGSRGNVISGKNLDGFLAVVHRLAKHCGIPQPAVFTQGKSNLTLPGYYRPIKNWDVVIVHRRRLVAALEFKSQVGSFGNNFNNRAEEVLGNASDFWKAAERCAYHPTNHKQRREDEAIPPDPRPPFLGYLMLLEDCDASTRPVRADSPHYRLLPGFAGASYAERYRLLCERLMEQKLYEGASLLLSEPGRGAADGAFRCLSEASGARNLFARLAASLLAAAQG